MTVQGVMITVTTLYFEICRQTSNVHLSRLYQYSGSFKQDKEHFERGER